MDTSGLQIGQEVGYIRHSYGSTHYAKSTITRITPTGRITLASNVKFDKYGHEIGGDDYHKAYLSPLVEIETALAEQTRQNTMAKTIKLIRFELDKLQHSKFTPITSEAKQTIINLVNSL